MSRLVPTLLTPRLRLRPFVNEDIGQICLLAGDRDVAGMTRTIPHPYPKEAARAWLTHTANLIDEGLLRQYAIATKQHDLLIGNLSLRKRSARECDAELSYWLGKPYWGRGYIPEAACAALRDAGENFALESVRAAALAVNRRSIRVLEKLGFTFDRTTTDQHADWRNNAELVLYAMSLDDVKRR